MKSKDSDESCKSDSGSESDSSLDNYLIDPNNIKVDDIIKVPMAAPPSSTRKGEFCVLVFRNHCFMFVFN